MEYFVGNSLFFNLWPFRKQAHKLQYGVNLLQYNHCTFFLHFMCTIRKVEVIANAFLLRVTIQRKITYTMEGRYVPDEMIPLFSFCTDKTFIWRMENLHEINVLWMNVMNVKKNCSRRHNHTNYFLNNIIPTLLYSTNQKICFTEDEIWMKSMNVYRSDLRILSTRPI